MFAYFTKINDKDIIAYTRGIISLYLNEDDNSSDDSGCTDEYLSNNQTIASGEEDIPPPLATPPLFSYC